MSYDKCKTEEKFANMTLEPNISELIEAEDFVRLCKLAIQDTPDVKSLVKSILSKSCSKDKIAKFLSALFSILSNDLSFWKCDNTIKILLNELEMESVRLLSQDGGSNSAQRIYDSLVENQFEALFDNYRKFLSVVINSPVPDQSFSHLCSGLLNFTKLVDIKGYQAVLFPMARFAEYLLKEFICIELVQPLILDVIVNINHRLIDYLTVTPGNAVSKGLRETISIYEFIRKSIINMTLVDPETISKALDILEHRSRYFGLYADAIPENKNHGDYIVIDPLHTPFEDDDVYDDYEKFLATLPS